MAEADAAVLVQVEHGVLVATLHRPSRLNALDTALRAELERLWLETSARDDVRCVVVTGSGRGFCSGADVDDLGASRTDYAAGVHEELSFLPGRQVKVPVIAAVNGVCAGGGLHFVADADFAIASTDATFVDPHVSVGQVSGIEPASLALRMPLGALARLALCGTAARLTAAEALQGGLVAEVVSPEQLLERAMTLATAVADASPTAVRATRALLRRVEEDIVAEWMQQGWDAVRAHWQHPDAAEGPQAWRERRNPRWLTP